jgi:RNA polymerase sigma factor (sigma-70 family)
VEDTALIERAKKGDAASYGRLVRRYQSVAFRAAYLVTGDAGEAEEAIQEAFVNAYRALGRFRPGAPFKPWLLKIVTNEARKRNRTSRQRTGLELVLSEDSSLREQAEISAEERFLVAEKCAELLKAVEGLREEDRLVIACRYFLELSEAETAEALDCARGTVKSRLSRAIERLRDYMGGAAHGPERQEGARGG